MVAPASSPNTPTYDIAAEDYIRMDQLDSIADIWMSNIQALIKLR